MQQQFVKYLKYRYSLRYILDHHDKSAYYNIFKKQTIYECIYDKLVWYFILITIGRIFRLIILEKNIYILTKILNWAVGK